jgi:hypothetical protein
MNTNYHSNELLAGHQLGRAYRIHQVKAKKDRTIFGEPGILSRGYIHVVSRGGLNTGDQDDNP